MTAWTDHLNEDPLPWLLDPATPGPRHLALSQLLGLRADDPELIAAQSAAMGADPIAAILDAQDPEGWWDRPGSGYSPKYRSLVWNLIFLDQLGADGSDPRIRRACEYALAWTQTSSGGFGALSQKNKRAQPATVLHCLNGNILRAMIGFGLLDDPRIEASIAWQAASITGEGMERWYAYTPGPDFRCRVNDDRPCAWGATKAVLGLARVPVEKRPPAVTRALELGVEFLMSRDPAIADYPMPRGNTAPNRSWFKPGFPSGYITDVLQVLEALADAGAIGDERLGHAFEWLSSQQDKRGRWANRYSYHGKLVRDIDRQGQPSKWVTIRACRVIKARYGAGPA
jgi:hypothetical protein